MTGENVLYDKELKIIYKSKSDSHQVVIAGKYSIFFKQGFLEELSRTPIEGLRDKLNAVNLDVDNILRIGALSYEKLWWAIIQARFLELDRELKVSASQIK